MGRALMCAGQYASTPFFLKNMDIRIYSIEELCYCIGEYTFLVDESMMDNSLVEWIIEECGMNELGMMLRRLMDNKATFGLFFTRLLYYVGYQSPEEVDRIGKFLDSNEGLDPIQRRKNVADYLISTERYEAALKQYHMLYYDLPPSTEDAQRGTLLHNMGVVNARLFRFREASKLFKKAFEMTGESESREQYLSAVRLWYTMEDKDGRFGMKRYFDLVASGGDSYHDISLSIERTVELVKKQIGEGDSMKMLEADVEEAGDNKRARFSVLADEADRIKSGYRHMIKE